MATALVALPIIDGLVSLILTGIEALKMKIGVCIHKDNQTISEINTPKEEVKHIIGFGIPSSEEYVEEEDDDL
jgi:hypothetical protein